MLTLLASLILATEGIHDVERPLRHQSSRRPAPLAHAIPLLEQIYNKVARTLVAFEYLWYQAWVQSIDQAKAGLQVGGRRLMRSTGGAWQEILVVFVPSVGM